MYGPMGGHDSDDVHVNFVRSNHDEMLSKQLEHFYNAEFGDTLVDVEQSFPFEDRRAKVDHGRIGGTYQWSLSTQAAIPSKSSLPSR